MEIENKDEKDSTINRVTIQLLNQGAHGCIYRPEIKCDSTIGSPKYISKIQTNIENVKSEMEIGELIKEKIKDYIYYYAPLLESCEVSLKEIPKDEKDKCELLQNYNEKNEIIPETKKYISTKIRYVGNEELETYMHNLPQEDKSLIKEKLEGSYKYLCWGLKKLADNDIIHFDIKEKNIVYDANARLPIIIDFGISFTTLTLNKSNYQNIFYTKRYYPYWCFDIYLISNIVQVILQPIENNIPTIQKLPYVVTKTVNLEIIEKIYDKYYLEFIEFVKVYLPGFNDTELLESKKQTIEYYYLLYKDKNWEELVEKELRPEIYRTWDHYSLAFTYLIIIRSLIIKEETNPYEEFTNNLKKIVLASPEKRPEPNKEI
jgi:serine/threonine protein kinase